MKEYAYETFAMGSEISVSFICDCEDDAVAAKNSAFTTICEYEKSFSRFISQSELSRLNIKKSLVVSDIFYEVYEKSIKLTTQTHHAFNPLLQISKFGYNQSFSTLIETKTIKNKAQYNTDITKIRSDKATKEITLLADQCLDFGGILKGFLSQKIALSLEKKYPHFQGIIINLGGDLHTRGYDEHNQKFVFSLYNPITQKEYFVPLYNQSLATSGTYKRKWNTSKGSYHHILDISGTKNTQNTAISASIIGTDGAVCEAYTKVLINLPLEESVPLITEEKLLYYAVDSQGNVSKNI